MASDFHLLSRQAIAGDTKWDYLSFEPISHRLFITHGDRVEVFDTLEKKLVGVVANTPGVHGVALAPELDRGYTSNGFSSTVSIFELSSLRVLGTLPTEKKPDAILYDAASQRVFVANGASGTLHGPILLSVRCSSVASWNFRRSTEQGGCLSMWRTEMRWS